MSLHTAFSDFVRSKPPSRRYVYVDISDCPFAQFLREKRHIQWPLVSPTGWFGFWFFVIPMWGKVPREIDRAINSCDGDTFGALAIRLAKARGEA